MIALTILAGCASMHPGYLATPTNSPAARTQVGALVVSARELTEYASPSLGLVELTFENKSADWIRIQELALDFGSAAANQHVRIVVGDDLVRWSEAIELRNEIRGYNATLAWAGMAAIATLGASVTRGSQAAPVGSAVLLGTVAGATIAGVSAARESAQSVPVYPATHLLAPGFTIPPALSIRRWVVLQSTNEGATGYIHRFHLDLRSDTGVGFAFEVPFRANCNSEWQTWYCQRATDTNRVRGNALPWAL